MPVTLLVHPKAYDSVRRTSSYARGVGAGEHGTFLSIMWVSNDSVRGSVNKYPAFGLSGAVDRSS